jgi:chromosome partitioning protein
VQDSILPTEVPFLDIIPSHIDLVGAEIEMINLNNRERKMKEALEAVKDSYDLSLWIVRLLWV